MLGGRFRHTAVAEVEHQRALAERIQNTMHGAAHAFTADHQPAWVEVALHHALALHRITRPDRIDMLIEADRIAHPGFGEIPIPRRNAARKDDHRHARYAL